MFIWTAHFSKKKALLALLAAAAVIALLLVLFSGRRDEEAPPELPRLTSNEERIAYLQSFGWELEPEPLETLQFLLPETLEEPYLTYNKLQQQQGFDLTGCAGKQIARYTYAVTNYPGRTSSAPGKTASSRGWNSPKRSKGMIPQKSAAPGGAALPLD